MTVKERQRERDEQMLGMRLVLIAEHAGLDPEELIDALEALTGSLPNAQGRATASLTAEEEHVYRKVGGLTHAMPDIASRASTTTLTRSLHLASSGLSVGEAARSLKVSPGRVRQRIGEGSLRAVKRGGAWSVLACQVTDQGEVPGIGEVTAAMPKDLPAIVVERFLTTPNVDLPVGERNASPVEWLLGGGEPSQVAVLAADLDLMS